jgi:hypothetical protein
MNSPPVETTPTPSGPATSAPVATDASSEATPSPAGTQDTATSAAADPPSV